MNRFGLVAGTPLGDTWARLVELGQTAGRGASELAVALLIVIVGWWLATLAGALTRALLRALRFDQAVLKLTDAASHEARRSASKLAGWAVHWGVLLFALDKETARLLGACFERQEVAKTYLAVVRGHPPETGRIDHALSRRRDDAEWVGDRSSDEAQPAVSDFRRLATCELPHQVDRYPTSRYALVEVTPHTGRRHQIRRHLKHIAHPIVGDATFGKGRHNRLFQQLFGCHRMLLACARLQLIHPYSGAPLDLIAPPDGEFASVLDALGWRAALPAELRPTIVETHPESGAAGGFPPA